MAKTREIEIPAPNTGTILVRIRGTSPLLQNPPTKRTLETLPGGSKSKKSGKAEKLTPEEEMNEILDTLRMPSSNGKGVYGFSKKAITIGMASAGYRLGSFTMASLRAALRVATPDDRIPIEGPEPELDCQLTSLSGRGASKVANRPKFWPWEATIPLEFDRGVLNEEQVLRILQDMGRGIGIGAYRPENNGPYGTFEVVGAEIQEAA